MWWQNVRIVRGAAKHAKSKKHKVRVDVGLVFEYDGRIQKT